MIEKNNVWLRPTGFTGQHLIADLAIGSKKENLMTIASLLFSATNFVGPEIKVEIKDVKTLILGDLDLSFYINKEKYKNIKIDKAIKSRVRIDDSLEYKKYSSIIRWGNIKFEIKKDDLEIVYNLSDEIIGIIVATSFRKNKLFNIIFATDKK